MKEKDAETAKSLLQSYISKVSDNKTEVSGGTNTPFIPEFPPPTTKESFIASMPKDFEKFLKDNGAYDKYCKNFDMEHCYGSFDKTRYVDIGFIWGDTEEGRSFWANLNKIWVKQNGK